MIHKILYLALLVAVPALANAPTVSAQAAKGTTYQEMSVEQQTIFVNEQARQIARELSGREYDFTPEFAALVQKYVDGYARRVGDKRSDPLRKGDVSSIIKRGQKYAPIVVSQFKAHNVSPLIGLYLPFIESAYVNIESPSPMGAVGLFQFLPSTGLRYGLSTEELLDVEKSADAAARYILDSLELFKGDSMGEALAILSYNRGGRKVVEDLQMTLTAQTRSCSVCALTAAVDQLDRSFKEESVYYLPNFFAAAIVGENPRTFGIKSEPLSWYASQ